MSFPRYPAYKHSGIERLGDVPEHWKVVPVKRCLKSITQGWSPQCENYPAEAGQWGVLKVGCVNGGSFDPSENKALPSDLEPLPELSIRQRDVLVSRANTRELVGSVAVAERDYERLILCDKLYRLRVDEQRCDAAFLASSLSTPASRGVIEATASGASSSMLNIGQAAITGMFIAVPPIKEQQALRIFVQNETAKIDTLVEEQRCLIELLKEKRQAVISQAVTKGLNPNVPMKDSGVAWLGKVPAHWTVSSIKRIVATPVTDGPHETPNFPDEGIPFVSAEAVSSGRLDFGKKRGYISVEDHQRYSLKYRPQWGDIYMIKSGATTGVTAIVETDDEFNIWSPLAVIRCNETCDPYFVLNYMRSRNFLEAVTLNWSFGTQQNIGMGVVENLSVLVPPKIEQSQIARALAVQLEGLELLSSEAETAIALLAERRSALISAAVTGKIDVRGLVPQPEAVAA